MGSIHFDITASDSQLTATITHAQGELDKFLQKQRQNSKEFIELFSNMGATSEMKEAYEELAMWADRSFTSQSEAIRGLEMSLHESQLSLKAVSDMMGELSRRYKEGEMAEEEYADAMSRLDILYKDISRSIGEVSAELQREMENEQMAEGSIESLRAKLSLLTVEYQKLSAEERNSDVGKNLLEQMKETSKALSDATSEMSTYGAETIDTYSRIDGLVTRLGTSLPSLLKSPMSLLTQMPSIIQNVEKAQEEYQKMMDSGKDSEPVWKQLIGAAFSWQTALLALAPIIIANRKEIYEWCYTLATGKDYAADYSNAVKEVEKALEGQIDSIAESVTSLKSLQKEWENLQDDEKEKWLKKNQSAFENLGMAINDAETAERIFSNPENTNKIVEALKLRAMATTALTLAQDKYAKSLQKQFKSDKKANKAESAADFFDKWFAEQEEEGNDYGFEQSEFAKKQNDWLKNFVINKLKSDSERKQKKSEKKAAGGDMFVDLYQQYQTAFEEAYKALGINPDELTPDNETVSRAAKNLVTAFLKATQDEFEKSGRNQLESPVAILTYDYSTQLNKLKEELDKAMAEASPEEQKALKEAYDQRVELYAQAFEDAQQKLREADEAEAAKTAAEQRKIYEDLLEQYETYQMAIERVNAKYDKDAEALRKGGASTEVLEQLEVQRQKAIKAIDSLFNPKDEDADATVSDWEKYAQVISNATTAINEMADAIGGVTGQVLKLIGSGITNGASILSVIDGGGLKSEDPKEKIAAYASLYGAVLGAVSGIVKGVKDSILANRQAAAAAREYNMALDELGRNKALEAFRSAFGTDSLGTLGVQMQQAEQATKKIKDLLSAFNEVRDFALQSDMRSGFQKIFGGGNIAGIRISDFYDFETGEMDGDKLAKWYSTYKDNVSLANRELIEDLLAQWETYKQAQEAMSDYLGGLFGSVASTIADHMVDAFVETGDALTDLTDVVQQYTKAMAKSIVESQLLSSIFNKDLEEKVGNMLLSGNIEGAAGLFKEAVDAVDALAPTINSWLGAVGVTGDWSSDAAGARAKGIAQASQDSVDELNGRFAAIQTHTFTMNENVKLILATNGVMADHLATIMEHTGNLAAMKVYLDRINSAVDQMSIKGVKILS